MESETNISKHSLLGKWRAKAYDTEADKGRLRRFWDEYFEKEKGIYKQLLADPDTEVRGTVKDLAKQYGIDIMTMTGFLDGINDSLVEKNPVETMTENTEVSLRFDLERLYKNMVAADAEWLYDLPEWEPLISKEHRKELFLEQKRSGTVVKGKKIGRNDPCPCGSGKKYKHCCLLKEQKNG